jgi:hypothetical protein
MLSFCMLENSMEKATRWSQLAGQLQVNEAARGAGASEVAMPGG